MKGKLCVIALLVLWGVSQQVEAQIARDGGLSLERVVIVSLHEKEQYIIVAYSDEDPYQKKNQVIVHVDDHTRISCANGIHPPQNVWQLTPGQYAEIVTNGVLTRSVPSQTLGLHIKLLELEENHSPEKEASSQEASFTFTKLFDYYWSELDDARISRKSH
ncbi:MAG: hypothetical protein ACRCW2_15550 [Cellulosilyticaceae bacterium]